MTVASEAVTVSYEGNGVTTAFTVTFPFFEIVVETIVAGIVLERALGSDYMIDGGAGLTGTVNFLVAPSDLTTVRIRRVTSRLQETDYEENDPFPAEVHEQALDRAHMILTELSAHLTRVRTLGPDDGAASELVIAAGVIAPTGSYHVVDTEGDAASDDLVTITPPTSVKDGDFLVLRIASESRPITIKNGTGNIVLADDLVLDALSDLCWLMYVQPLEKWVELNGRPGAKGEKGNPGASGSGTGDMLAENYDPNEVGGDAFSMDNMVEGSDAKIMTAAERTALGTALQPDDIGDSVQGYSAKTLKADVSQTLEVGFASTAYDRGTVTTTEQVPTYVQGNVQKMVRNGAFTLKPPASGEGPITILVTNGASASTLTTSDFTKSNTDDLTDTESDVFLFHIMKVGSVTRLWVEALQ